MIIHSLKNILRFQVERFILQGTFHRLLFIALIIVLISLSGGILVFWTATGFNTEEEAVWWAFLRLTDPGYLGDDVGGWKRTVATILTVLGYVVFMGALIAILTQWLHETINRLQSGLTPIYRKNHILILGWNERTPSIVKQLLRSEGRIKRFLTLHRARRLHIVILSPTVTPDLMQALKDKVGPGFNPGQVTFRTGTPLQLEHLERVDFLRAAAIMLPSESPLTSPAASPDGRVIKILLSTSTASRKWKGLEPPLMVAEIVDSRNKGIAEASYKGPIEIIACDGMTSRAMAQIIRRPGLSWVFTDLFVDQAANKVFVREGKAMAGMSIAELTPRFSKAIPFACTRKENGRIQPIFNPPDHFKVQEDDRVFFLARDYEDTGTMTDPVMSGPKVSPPSPGPKPAAGDRPKTRVLILGWNRVTPALIHELDQTTGETFELVLLSTLPISDRERQMEREAIRPTKLTLEHHEKDYTSPSDLASVNPGTFDRIVFLANDRLETDGESEARILLGYLVLQEFLRQSSRRPHILVELMNEENRHLFEEEGDETIVTPLLLNNTMTQVTLRRELNAILESLFSAGGTELVFRKVGYYGLGQGTLRFPQIQAATRARQETAMGIRLAGGQDQEEGGVIINPDQETDYDLSEEDEIIVVAKD